MDNTKIGIKRGNSYSRNIEVSRLKAQINEKSTQKFNWHVLTFTVVFLNQKGINLCEHIVKMMPVLSKSHQGKEQEEGTCTGDGGKNEWKLSEVNRHSLIFAQQVADSVTEYRVPD